MRCVTNVITDPFVLQQCARANNPKYKIDIMINCKNINILNRNSSSLWHLHIIL